MRERDAVMAAASTAKQPCIVEMHETRVSCYLAGKTLADIQ